MNQNRREFFKRSATAGALVTVPYVFAKAEKVIPKEDGKQTVAAIGVGGSRGAFSQGGAIARRAAELGRMVAVCDVDAVHAAEFNSKFDNRLAMYSDYRKMLEGSSRISSRSARRTIGMCPSRLPRCTLVAMCIARSRSR